LSKIIIDNAIVPKFRADDYAGGIKDGVRDIIKVLTGDAAEVEDRAKARPDADEPAVDWLMVLFWVLMLSWIVYSIYRSQRYATATGPGAGRRSGPIFLPGPGSGGSDWGGGWSGGGGGFSGGGGSFGGGGASGGW
jgi:uncharacterized protein